MAVIRASAKWTRLRIKKVGDRESKEVPGIQESEDPNKVLLFVSAVVPYFKYVSVPTMRLNSRGVSTLIPIYYLINTRDIQQVD